MIEKQQLIHIGFSVNFKSGCLRPDYKMYLSGIIGQKGYSIDSIEVYSDRIEMSIKGKFQPPQIIEKELTYLGQLIEKEISIIIRKKCFVIMPFSHEDLNVVYKDFVKPNIEKLSIDCVRGDDIFGENIIMDDIIKAIGDANILVADLTYRNPNVFYELGIAHAKYKKVLMLAQSIDDVPFDLRHRRICLYKYTPRGCKELEIEIVKNIEAIIKE